MKRNQSADNVYISCFRQIYFHYESLFPNKHQLFCILKDKFSHLTQYFFLQIMKIFFLLNSIMLVFQMPASIQYEIDPQNIVFKCLEKRD